ncbi:hypothetical protein [Streptomyces sp. MBT49]|uniref:hypothetical protein n=1 Tax=Streptomyces sp. MBT49 TaxID=1488380 RepID=UPI001F1F2C78|nr:hypothetical protein [Streptomyces sp. MBT49]
MQAGQDRLLPVAGKGGASAPCGGDQVEKRLVGEGQCGGPSTPSSLTIDWPMTASASQREVVRQAQSLLTEAIEQADVGEFDGNEYVGGEVVLYAYVPDTDALFAVMAPILNDLPFRPAHVVLRYGSVDDPSAAEHRVDL